MAGKMNLAIGTKTIGTMLHGAINKERAYLKAWDFTLLRETAINLADVVDEAINIAKKEFNAKVYCVVSDNASNMGAMGRKVDVWHSTCMSHTGNLLAKSMINQDLNAKVNKVLKEFKNPELEKLVVNAGGKRISTACETRWCSYRDSYRSYIDNLQFMTDIAIQRTSNR